MDQFYIRLPSNSSMNVYPENRTSSYVTKLSNEIHLTGRWEIGLKEIQYPLSWFNIEEWVGNFTVDATNVADIEKQSQSRVRFEVACRLLLVSDKTGWKKNNRNVSSQHAVRFEGVHKRHI